MVVLFASSMIYFQCTLLSQLEPALMAVTGVTALERAGILSSHAASVQQMQLSLAGSGSVGVAGGSEASAASALSALWSTASNLLSPGQQSQTA